MKLWDKVLVIIFAGSLWGVLELFGWDFLRMIDAPSKATILYMFGFFILVASLRILKLPVALLYIGLITVAYKALGVQFFMCQSAAIMLDAAFVGLVFHIISSDNLKDWRWRTGTAALTTFLAFLSFGIFREYGYAAVGYVKIGFEGAINYLVQSGIPAIILSIIVVHPAYHLGNVLREKLPKMLNSSKPKWAYGAGLTFITLAWIASILH